MNKFRFYIQSAINMRQSYNKSVENAQIKAKGKLFYFNLNMIYDIHLFVVAVTNFSVPFSLESIN